MYTYIHAHTHKHTHIYIYSVEQQSKTLEHQPLACTYIPLPKNDETAKIKIWTTVIIGPARKFSGKRSLHQVC